MSDGHMTDLDRFGKITASLVPAILRSDPTKSRKWAWRCITGREPITEPGPDAVRGLEHEEDAVAAVEVELATLALPGRFVNHRDIDWLGASPDGFIFEQLEAGDFYIPIEAKCPRELHTAIPDRYYDQVQTQLEVCNCPHAYFVSWTENGQWVKKVERDPAWWKYSYPELLAFYEEFVKPDIEPPKSPRRPSGKPRKPGAKKESVEESCERGGAPTAEKEE